MELSVDEVINALAAKLADAMKTNTILELQVAKLTEALAAKTQDEPSSSEET